MPTSGSKIDKKFNSFYDDLKKYLSNLEDRFLKIISDTEPDLGKFEYEIKAYLILSHGAIEEYIENIVQEVLDNSISRFINKKKIINEALLSLAGCYGNIRIDGKESSSEQKSFDYIRKDLLKIKSEFSKTIRKNHGIDIVRLRKLLIPVAISIKDDPDIKNSLQQLSKERGNYAHKGSGAKKIVNPTDAKKYIKGCCKFCLDIRDKAKQLFK